MSKEPNNIDRIVRQKLDGFEMAPPPSVWNATEAAMAKPNRKGFFLWFFLGMAALAFVAVGVYYFSLEDSKKAQLANEKTTQELTKITREKSSGTKNQSEKTKANAENNRLNNLNDNSDNLEDSDLFDASNGKSQGEGKLSGDDDNSNTQAAGNSISSDNGNDFIQSTQSAGTNNTKNKTNTKGTSGAKKGINSNLNNSLNPDAQIKNVAGANTQSTNSGDNNGSTGRNLTNDSNEGTIENENNGNQQEDGVVDLGKINPLDSLPTTPIQLIETGNEKPVASNTEDILLPTNTPLWKIFSIEGAFGISTFKNKVAKNTEPEFMTLLNSASTNRRSYDFRLGLNYHITKQFSFQTGVEYNASREDYSFSTQTTTSSTTYDSISAYYDSTLMVYIPIFDTIINFTTDIQTTKKQNYYRLLTLPFQFAWNQPLSIRSELEFAVGGAISIYGRNNGSTIVDTNTVIPSSDAYHTNGMLSLGGSIKYLHNFGSRHAVYIEPWVQFGITNQFAPQLNYQSSRRRYGIRFGYRFYF